LPPTTFRNGRKTPVPATTVRPILQATLTLEPGEPDTNEKNSETEKTKKKTLFLKTLCSSTALYLLQKLKQMQQLSLKLVQKY
jgi:hypothetical protein